MENPHLAEPSLPLSVLDFVGIEHGEPATASIAGSVEIARAVEHADYRRYWVSEHHNMRSLACSAPEILIAHLGAKTERIRVGAAGIMLPNHAPFKVAEMFRTLLAMYPGRIDLGLGRAPGTDPLTAHVLRRGLLGIECVFDAHLDLFHRCFSRSAYFHHGDTTDQFCQSFL